MKKDLMKRIYPAILAGTFLLNSMIGCVGNNASTTKQTVTKETLGDAEQETTYEGQSDSVVEEITSEQDYTEEETTNAAEALNESQKKSISMLNYLTVLTQEINASKNSRIYLENAYASLISNTNPDKVNELTESYLESLLDTLEKYRMIAAKRERLQFLYEQNKAKALRAAIPNPLGLLSAVESCSITKLVASVAYMAIDATTSYESYNDEIKLDFIKDGWELDDDEAENLHESRKRAFTYMVDIVREENLPGELALNDKAVEDFVKWKNSENYTQRIQFLTSNQKTYEAFGYYWLVLADSYFEDGQYDKCLECISKYENIHTSVLRKDYDLANILPKAIAAAEEMYDTKEYVVNANKFAEDIMANTEVDDWYLRYLAAQTFINLYAKTGDESYMNKAYSIISDNVNVLIEEQLTLNKKYTSDIEKITAEDDATKETKKQIDAYNEAMEKQRKTELPPIYEPLIVNCDLLFDLIEKMNIEETEKTRIDKMLHNNGEQLFLVKTIDDKYRFSVETCEIPVVYYKDEFSIPAEYVTNDSVIKVTVNSEGIESVYDDWKITKVDRKEADVSSYIANYESKTAYDQKWSEGATVKVEVFESDDLVENPLVFNFVVTEYKHHNILENKVVYEQVKENE